MLNPPRGTAYRFAGSRSFGLATVLFALTVSGAACKHSSHTSDPQLRPIEAMLDQQLPTGTSSTRVAFFLASRGYALETSAKPNTIVADIRHIDTQTLQPVTARVTFYFDASDHLIAYDLERTTDNPLQPQPDS